MIIGVFAIVQQSILTPQLVLRQLANAAEQDAEVRGSHARFRLQIADAGLHGGDPDATRPVFSGMRYEPGRVGDVQAVLVVEDHGQRVNLATASPRDIEEALSAMGLPNPGAATRRLMELRRDGPIRSVPAALAALDLNAAAVNGLGDMERLTTRSGFRLMRANLAGDNWSGRFSSRTASDG